MENSARIATGIIVFVFTCSLSSIFFGLPLSIVWALLWMCSFAVLFAKKGLLFKGSSFIALSLLLAMIGLAYTKAKNPSLEWAAEYFSQLILVGSGVGGSFLSTYFLKHHSKNT